MTSAVKQFAFTEEQVAKLMAMQDQLNTYIHPEWKNQGFDWETAVNDECMEILGHLGWKWWKDKTYKQGVTVQNKAQIKLELIDILHFVLSSRIEFYAPEEYIQIALNTVHNNRHGLYEKVKQLQQDALHYGITSDTVTYLSNLMHIVGLTEQEIIETYTQKYVLNKFRQDHGYKDGSYVKVWHMPHVDPNSQEEVWIELEDNEVLAQTVAQMKEAGADTTNETILYSELCMRYNCRLNK